MSYIQITVHCVWGTKNREPILISEKRAAVFQHIKENAVTKGIYIDTIGGYTDHIHCLISLGGEPTIAKTIQLIKGEVSFWANKNNLFAHKLEWAEDYFAASVSKSSLDKVRAYISNQDEHHRKITFAEEYERFINRYNFELG